MLSCIPAAKIYNFPDMPEMLPQDEWVIIAYEPGWRIAIVNNVAYTGHDRILPFTTDYLKSESKYQLDGVLYMDSRRGLAFQPDDLYMSGCEKVPYKERLEAMSKQLKIDFDYLIIKNDTAEAMANIADEIKLNREEKMGTMLRRACSHYKANPVTPMLDPDTIIIL